MQKGFEGSSIQAWEKAHNIARVMRDGCEYVICTDWDEFQRKDEAEREYRRRAYVAEQQAAAYFGGGR